MRTTGSNGSVESMFAAMQGWTTQFEYQGKPYGGTVPLDRDERLKWHLDQVGGCHKKTILELGSLEGGHTALMEFRGAIVTAIEGLSDCWLRSLIVKEAFGLTSKFIFADFNEWLSEYSGPKFDIVSAAGILYHQTDPAGLIFKISEVTDTVLVWSQVANSRTPSMIECQSMGYRGRMNNYGSAFKTSDSYMGGLNQTALWLYPDEMIRCFMDAGFTDIIQKEVEPNVNGGCIMFVAKK